MDATHSHAPFPATFLIHEQRVRGYWPFANPIAINSSNPFPKQDWILSDAQDISTGGISRAATSGPSSVAMKQMVCDQPSETGAFTFKLDAETIEQILFATRNSESWKACVREGTSWEGTAEENIAKYKDIL